jgi:hypothetical protein
LNGIGLSLSHAVNNTISGNIVSGGLASWGGLALSDAINNTIFCNGFSSSWANNQLNVGNKLDNGTHGNFWRDYKERYPHATTDGTVWDTPYVISSSVIDSKAPASRLATSFKVDSPALDPAIINLIPTLIQDICTDVVNGIPVKGAIIENVETAVRGAIKDAVRKEIEPKLENDLLKKLAEKVVDKAIDKTWEKIRGKIVARMQGDIIETTSTVIPPIMPPQYSGKQLEETSVVPPDGAEKERIDKLRKIIKVSTSLQISRLANLLDVDEEFVWNNIIDWAERFGFTIDNDKVVFGQGNTNAFIDDLDKKFSAWDEKSRRKDGKI